MHMAACLTPRRITPDASTWPGARLQPRAQPAATPPTDRVWLCTTQVPRYTPVGNGRRKDLTRRRALRRASLGPSALSNPAAVMFGPLPHEPCFSAISPSSCQETNVVLASSFMGPLPFRIRLLPCAKQA